MNEVLYQGKRRDTDEWVQGSLLRSGNGYIDIIPLNNTICEDESDALCVGKWYVVDPETVGQYIGISDKNGVKIFEGAIVRVCLDPEIRIGHVKYNAEIGSFTIVFDDDKCVLFLDLWQAKKKAGSTVWIEVIGNIHDSPEPTDGNQK